MLCKHVISFIQPFVPRFAHVVVLKAVLSTPVAL